MPIASELYTVKRKRTRTARFGLEDKTKELAAREAERERRKNHYMNNIERKKRKD